MVSYGNHAVVLGASGVGGWSFVDQLLRNYPAVGTFSTVTALVNRPLAVEDCGWLAGPDAPKLQLVSGIDLTAGTYEQFIEVVRKRVPDAGSVTHVFAWSFKPDMTDGKKEAALNFEMLKRAALSFEEISPKLEMFLFPGGAKRYGIHVGAIYDSPFVEDMPRDKLPKSQQDQIHYFAMEDFLREQTKGKSWSWCELHFDAVIGFSPHGSVFNLTAHWGTYLSLYAAVEGKGARIPFPGTKEVYHSLNNEAGADMIARMAIWCSLNPDRTAGEIFNIADSAEGLSNVQRWPKLAAYFGLEGVAPDEAWAAKDVPLPGKYIEKHAAVLEERGIKPNTVFGSAWLDGYGQHFNFDRVMSLDKARKAGFVEERDPIKAWQGAWDQFKRAGMLLQ